MIVTGLHVTVLSLRTTCVSGKEKGKNKKQQQTHIHLSSRANNHGPQFKTVLNTCLSIERAESLTFLIQMGPGICTAPLAKDGLSGAVTFAGSKGSNL